MGQNPIRLTSQLPVETLNTESDNSGKSILPAAGILLACRTTYQEAMPIFYGTVTFHISLNPARGSICLASLKDQLAIMHHLSLDFEYNQCRHGSENSPFQTRLQRELAHVPWAAEVTDSIHLIADNCLQLKTFTLHILSDSYVYSPLIRPFARDYNLLDAALNGTTVSKANLWAMRQGETPHQRREGQQSILHETRFEEALASHRESYLGRALCKISARDLITFVAFSGFMGGPVDSWAELRSALPGAFWQRKKFTQWPQLSLCKQQRQALDRLAILPHPSQEVPFVNVWHYRPDGSRLEKTPEWKYAVDGEVERDLEKAMWKDGRYCKIEETKID